MPRITGTAEDGAPIADQDEIDAEMKVARRAETRARRKPRQPRDPAKKKPRTVKRRRQKVEITVPAEVLQAEPGEQIGEFTRTVNGVIWDGYHAMGQLVRGLAAMGTPVTRIAEWLGKNESFVRRHFSEELKTTKEQLAQAVGAKVIEQALGGDTTSQRLFLTTQGGWRTKFDFTASEEEPEKRMSDAALEKVAGGG